jgi:thiamine-monophosphate kinase
MQTTAALSDADKLDCVLGGGDDYELVFTAPPGHARAVMEAATVSGVAVQRIGNIDAQRGLRVVDGAGQAVTVQTTSFDHFA